MLIFSQLIRAWLDFQRCSNAVLTMAGRPDMRWYWNARDAGYLSRMGREQGERGCGLSSQSRTGHRPGRCQKRLLTEIKGTGPG